MADPSKIKEFPDLSNKLQAPTKISTFQRQKAEAEAKRLKQEAENEAALKKFAADFGDDGEDDALGYGQGTRGGFGGRARGRGGAFTSLKSGPGSLGPPPTTRSGPGSLGPPPPLSRKRPFDSEIPSQWERDEGRPAFKKASARALDAAFQNSDEEDEGNRRKDDQASKPYIFLSNIPPQTVYKEIVDLIPADLTNSIEKFDFDPDLGDDNSCEDLSVLVYFEADTPVKDIDAAVNALKRRYLGSGYYLSAQWAMTTTDPRKLISLDAPEFIGQPFGAKPVQPSPSNFSDRIHAPPISAHKGGIGPPPSYDLGTGMHSSRNITGAAGTQPDDSSLRVFVAQPADLDQLRLIHKTIEAVLSRGYKFEAALMDQPEVQKEEKWAFLFCPASSDGVYYRWRLWEIRSGAIFRKNVEGEELFDVFEDSPLWVAPPRLPFEFVAEISDLISDSGYHSSDDSESDDDGQRRRFNRGGAPPQEGTNANPQDEYLNPLRRAKLVHALARLPTTTARLRNGDISHVTSCAITHSVTCSGEVVELIVLNILKPLCWTSASLVRRKLDGYTQDEDGDSDAERKEEKEDPSSARLIALYAVNDIISSSSTCGVRQAWRLRSMFEESMKEHRIFEHLGRLDRDLQMGRLRAEKWKRGVNNILSLWEGKNFFSEASQQHFVNAFSNPPLSKEEKDATEKAEREAREPSKSRWRPVEARASEEKQVRSPSAATAVAGMTSVVSNEVEGTPTVQEDVEGFPMESADEVDGEPMDEDLDGAPMDDDDIDGEKMDEDEAPEELDQRMNLSEEPPGDPSETAAARARKRRPRAEDMY